MLYEREQDAMPYLPLPVLGRICHMPYADSVGPDQSAHKHTV